MTKEKRQTTKAVLRSILIGAGVVVATYLAPKGIKVLDKRLQDADYAEEHNAIEFITNRLAEREANALQRGEHDDPKDPYVIGLKKELEFRQKRHAKEKKNAKCDYCEVERE